MSQGRKAPSHERHSHSPPLPEATHDWVCLKCNNLNFSFRKKCNRCKVQSREDNEQLFYADYYYYNHYYAYPQNPAPQRQSPNYHNIALIEDPLSPKKKLYESECDPAERQDDHLPSVSPLVKKYCSGRSKKNLGNRSVFVWKLFGEQTWSEGQLPAVVPPSLSKDLSLTDDEQPSNEFTLSVQKMII